MGADIIFQRQGKETFNQEYFLDHLEKNIGLEKSEGDNCLLRYYNASAPEQIHLAMVIARVNLKREGLIETDAEDEEKIDTYLKEGYVVFTARYAKDYAQINIYRDVNRSMGVEINIVLGNTIK
jgi:hypothetical protein